MQKKLINLPILFLYSILLAIVFFQKAISDETYKKGKEIFLENGNCVTCHTLSDAGSNGNIGPNLNEIKPDMMRVLMAVTNGIGVMPAYQGILSEEEIEAVAKYVSESSLK